MEPNFCGPNPDFLGTTENFGVLLPEQRFLGPHQIQCFAFGSVGAQTVSLHNIPTLYDRLGHTLCKGLLEPNFCGYRDRCFVIVISLMMIFRMECSTTPILVKGLIGFIRKISIVGFPRIILFGVKWLFENGPPPPHPFPTHQK